MFKLNDLPFFKLHNVYKALKKGELMNNTYHTIAEQILKIENARRNSIFQKTVQDNRFEDEYFIRAYTLLKERYCAVFTLFGERNFKEVVYIFTKTNPLHAFKEIKYGYNFPDFLASLDEMQNFYFVRFIAMLDWFWFSAASPKTKIQLPKGTLKSWGTIIRGEDLVNIELNEIELETLSIQKNGKEYKIIEH